MQLSEAILQALQAAWSHKLRSFFTLLGIIVSVAFLVAVVAIIQGMNAYVRERIGGAIVGANAFQVRRTPIAVGLIDDEAWKAIQRRPIIAPEDVPYVARALPEAKAIALQSGWPTPQADIVWRAKTVGDVFVFGVTAPFQVVQDYAFAAGEPLSDIDVRERRPVVELGYDISDRLFDDPHQAVGERIRILGQQYTVKGVVAKKGTVLGQSWDGFVMMPLSSFEALYGRRKTTVISVKMPAAALVQGGMQRAEEAMRIAHKLRPGQSDDFTVDTADALVSFWKNLTRARGAGRRARARGGSRARVAREPDLAASRPRHALVYRGGARPGRERGRSVRGVSGDAGRTAGSRGGVEVRMIRSRGEGRRERYLTVRTDRTPRAVRYLSPLPSPGIAA